MNAKYRSLTELQTKLKYIGFVKIGYVCMDIPGQILLFNPIHTGAGGGGGGVFRLQASKLLRTPKLNKE